MDEKDEAFEELKGGHGLLRELPGLRVWGVDDGALVLGEEATQFLFCSQGALTVRQAGAWPHVLTAGMYASVPGKCEVRPVGQDLSQGLVISRHGWLGMLVLGGPLEERGRLRYIDGCTDSLLVPPVRLGDPCLNGLWFPMGTRQTAHTHPSVRIGMVVRGRGRCVTRTREWELRVAALTGGLVPTVQLLLDPVHRMMSTIRHNRARGTHAVVRMAEIVRGMVDDGVPAREIQKRLGMEREEVTRLINRAGMPAQVSKGRAGALNRAWVPGKG